ncbi:MAG TPA: DegT/DnrJ/EryC1/StrS aminotransferase family protein [Acidimicrobiia bacterium]
MQETGPRRRLPDPGAVHDEREIEAVVGVLRTSNLALGKNVAELERRVAELLAKRHGVMVNSGSSALRLAIDLLELEPGDEIVTPVVTFGTDVAPMVQTGLVPVFVDVEPHTYQIDADAVEDMIGPRTRAILAPNLVGNVPDWDRIRAIADAHGLRVVEDSCDVLDSWLRGTRTGARADISVTSFARGHAITAAGNGGLVGVDDEDELDRCLSLRRWGRRSETYLFGSRRGDKDRFGPLADGTPYDLVFLFDSVGYNFEPSELGAAYGLVQLDKLADYNERRRLNWQRLDDFFARHDDKVIRPRSRPDAVVTWMRYPFILRDDLDRTEIQRELEARGIATLMVWTGNVLRQPGFAGIERREPAGGFPNADRVMDRALSVPAHHALSSDDLGYMLDALGEVLDRT